VAVDLVGVVCGECAFFFLPSPPRPACLFLVSAFFMLSVLLDCLCSRRCTTENEWGGQHKKRTVGGMDEPPLLRRYRRRLSSLSVSRSVD
jgi:hypothetical protein